MTNETQLNMSNECCAKALSLLKQEIEILMKSNEHRTETLLESTNETNLNM